jgi:hypothetical protein
MGKRDRFGNPTIVPGGISYAAGALVGARPPPVGAILNEGKGPDVGPCGKTG